jgi:hypothetical protein
MTLDQRTIDSMSQAGIIFAVNFRAAWGGSNAFISAAEVPLFVADPDAAAARHHGVSKELFCEWVASEGSVQCSANTTSGHRCKNHLSGGGQQEIGDWLKMRGGYCVIHGGEPSTNPK